MDFVVPWNMPPIATYRVMNRDGIVEDEDRVLEGVTDEQVLGWYKNMVFGTAVLPGGTFALLFIDDMPFDQFRSWIPSCPMPKDRDGSASIWLVTALPYSVQESR